MARFSVVLDACVLVPIAQADTLLCLAEAGLYRPLWTTRILDETVRALEHVHPDMKESKMARNRAAVMNDASRMPASTGGSGFWGRSNSPTRTIVMWSRQLSKGELI